MKTATFTKPLTVMLSPDDYDRIKMITDKEQISMAQWVREALAEALKNIPDTGRICSWYSRKDR